MVSTDQKNTRLDPPNQAKNGFGRIPDELLPQIVGLPNQAAKLFLVLSLLANRKKQPVGEVPQSVSELSRMLGCPRKSVYRSLDELVSSGLVVSSGHGRPCVIVTHYLGHEDTYAGHEDTGGVSSCHTSSPQEAEHAGVTPPLYEVNTRDEVNTLEEPSESEASGHTSKPEKKHRKVEWNDEHGCLEFWDFDYHDEFEDRWKEELGSETFKAEMRKLNQWLRHPERKARRSGRANLVNFLENWMKRAIGGAAKSGNLF